MEPRFDGGEERSGGIEFSHLAAFRLRHQQLALLDEHVLDADVDQFVGPNARVQQGGDEGGGEGDIAWVRLALGGVQQPQCLRVGDQQAHGVILLRQSDRLRGVLRNDLASDLDFGRDQVFPRPRIG